MNELKNIHNFWKILFLSIFLLPSFQLRAQSEEIESDFDMKEVVFDHLGDSYQWHIATLGKDKELILYLPVIVYSKHSGWSIFSSSNVENGEYKGFKIAEKNTLNEGKIVEQINGEWVRPILDLSLTKVAFSLVLNSLVLLVIILIVARWYKKRDFRDGAPGGFIGFMEMFIMMIYDDVIKDSIPNNAKKFAPYLLTVFFFIFLNNLISLVPIFPGGVSVTGNIAITFFLAICTFIAVNLFGTKHYWKDIFWPDVPLLLKCPIPLMPIIEFMGIFTKPIALMIRLFANMMAGHVAILIFVCLIFIGAKMGPALEGGLGFISVLFTLFMNLLELLVAFIQAYVFTLLSAVFIGLAQEGKQEKTAKE